MYAMRAQIVPLLWRTCQTGRFPASGGGGANVWPLPTVATGGRLDRVSSFSSRGALQRSESPLADAGEESGRASVCAQATVWTIANVHAEGAVVWVGAGGGVVVEEVCSR